MLSDLSMDVKYALRTMRQSPVFTVAAVLVLTLGIGVTTALFSVVDAVLLRPLSFPEPERLVVLSNARPGKSLARYSLPNYEDVARRSTQLRSMTAYGQRLMNLTGQGDAEQLRGAVVVGDFFGAFGTKPMLGRTFAPEERAAPLTVISYARWLKEGGGAGVLGRTLTLGGQPYTVIGVMPPSFDAPSLTTEVWVPFDSLPGAATSDERTQRGFRSFAVAARLAQGATLESARHELEGLREELLARDDTTLGLRVVRYDEHLTQGVSLLLWVLLGAVSLVLLLAAANVAHLQLARAAARQREMGIRVALGAGRGRLMRQLLTESVLLALMGGVGGVLLALWITDVLMALGADKLPRSGEVVVHGRVLVFALAVTLTTGVGVGLVPALQRTQLSPATVLGRGATETSRGRAHAALVVAEVALALMLVTSAGLMLKSFWRMYQSDPGLDPAGVFVARLALPQGRYDTPERTEAFHRELTARLSARPEVAGVGVGESLPAGGSISRSGYWKEGSEDPPVRPDALINAATPGFLEALRVPLRAGRLLTEADGAKAPRVAVVSERFAREVFPDQDPIGRRISFGGDDEQGNPLWTTVVGVVADVAYAGVETGHEPTAYVPMAQEPTTDGQLAVRAAPGLDPRTLESVVREELRAVDSSVALARASTLEERLAMDLGQPRFRAVLLGAFGVLALVLAAVGIYGVMSYSVAQRSHEMGVRLALGARGVDVLWLVVGQALRRVGLGLGLGLLGALAAHRIMEGLLYGMGALDVPVLAGVALLLLGTAWLASWLPARRAASVDPASVLRRG
ncbi:ABC transporter permease [Myxococcus faecalis]|uniref:ABC transporter permease n=1 Tax=Myxococcus TaxID=32 RepID=UPI001CBE0524|nr:ABC transporter permease [Myxococcus sp. XM-1-1-1]MBZ4412674.1 ABC transporter permease [Myxococcus sp. XM-1-1-1]BDT38360.1 ABC transporter permease [Myxococcus sp. MH1]